MRNNQLITFYAIFCLTFVAVQLVTAGGGGHGHGHGHGHGGGGGGGGRQCSQAQQFFNQWWPQSQLGPVFQIACRQVGVTQAWALLQGILGVPATGALDQTTFQTLLNNANHSLLAQQLLASLAAVTPIGGK